MAKRFLDTAIWMDQWFRELPVKDKVFWIFLVSQCDPAGYWKKDYGLASYLCGFKVENDQIKGLNKGKERVRDFESHLEIADFVHFQYGTLTESCKPHKAVLNLLEHYKNKGLVKGYITLQDKDKEKDKDKDQERGIVKGETPRESSADFFSNPSKQESVIAELVAAGVPEDVARREVGKFVSYWTEKNKSGTKQRWEMEKTFEVRRRLGTWLRNINQFQNKGIGRELKIISY